MNPDTNELVRIKNVEEMAKLKQEGFISVPPDLDRAARSALGKEERVIISKTSGGKLSKWAAKKRKRRAELKKMVEVCNAYYS